ncbi:MAG: hypothetical protein Q8S01_06905, partial [Ignavibacteria bacterium]|nr:hypothetical protein [Ignavibacteria bacterium]
VTPVISNVDKLGFQHVGYTKDTTEQFVNIFKAEHERIIHVSNNEVSDANLAKGGKYFYFIPAFNQHNMKKDLKAKRITQEQYDAVWNSDDSIQQVYNKEVLEPLITKYMDDAIMLETKSWMKKLKSFNALELLPEKQMNYLLQTWNNIIPITEFVKGKPVTTYMWIKDGVRAAVTKEEGLNLGGRMMVKQYVTQAFIMNTFSAMVVSGDPAVAFKASKVPGATVNAHIKSTMKDYQKRQAKDIAPGAIPAFDPADTFVSLVIQDEKMHSEMAKINPAFKDKDTIADAQEVTTVREQLTVMFKEGKVADQTYNEMIAIIDAGMQSANKFYEFTEPAHTQVIFQAQKPVYVNRRFTEGSYTTDYIKSSSFALLPQFTIGTEIDKLRKKMEGTMKAGKLTGHINRAVFTSGKKLGQPIKPVSLYDNQGRIKDWVLHSKEFLNAQQTLSREGFKIQQEVPYKGDKESISLVSQADRFITAGISKLENFQLPGREPMSGKELKALRLATIKEFSDIALEKFTKEIGGIVHAKDMKDSDDAWIGSRLTDPAKFFDKLLAEAITKGYSENEIELLSNRKSDGRPHIPLWFSGSASKLESMVMSLVGQITIPKIPGKSFIQASSIGIKRYSTEIPPNSGIKYIQGFDPTKGLGFMTKNEGEPSGAAQVLVPFGFFDQGKALNIQNFMAEDGTIDPSKLPVELLRMVGMRIPNQGLNSMLPIQIVGFLPESMGDLIIVPAEITIQMGSDFDVDKLYTYHRNYSTSAEGLHIYNGDERFKQLQNTYFDIYWASLTHPDLFDAVTTPLDLPDMIHEKNLAEEGTADDSLSNFFMPSAQIE